MCDITYSMLYHAMFGARDNAVDATFLDFYNQQHTMCISVVQLLKFCSKKKEAIEAPPTKQHQQ